MQLPSRLEAFVDEQRQVNKRVESDISGLKAGQKELRTWSPGAASWPEED